MNLGLLLRKSATTFSAREALTYGGFSETYREMDGRVNALANSLLDLGLKKGDKLVIIQHNCHQLMETLFACFKTGIVAVPTNSRLHPSEFAYIINHCDASSVVFSEDFRTTIETVGREADLTGKHLVCLSEPAKGQIAYDSLLTGSQDVPASLATLDDEGWLFYTSGTTGKPKGAILTQRNLMVMTMNFLADVYHVSPEDRALHVAPLTHGSGLYLLPMIARGASNTILKMGSFDPGQILNTVEKERTTTIPFLTPTMIKMLLLSPHLGKHDLSSLRCIVYGGSPMYVDDLKDAIRRIGRVFVQIYGQGEAPMTISYFPRDEHVLEAGGREAQRLGSAGIPRTDTDVRIFDEADREVPPGAIGEIVVSGDIVMKGYLNDPRATAEVLRNGWLHTGDVGYADADGYIYIMDRKKDMIISGGSNIYPREVEEVVLRHPAVQEVTVVGVPDPVWGESVKAIVVLKGGAEATEQQIIDFCRENIASYKKPKSVEFVASIPKNAYGKILKREVRAKYWEAGKRSI